MKYPNFLFRYELLSLCEMNVGQVSSKAYVSTDGLTEASSFFIP